MKKLLDLYASYNLWANTRIVNKLKELDPVLWDKEVPASFPSLKKTVYHIWDAELIWLARLEKKVIPWPPTATVQDPSFEKFIDSSKNFSDYVSSKDETWLHAETSYINSKGIGFTNYNYAMVMHCMNHSTFHRGQVISILRSLKIEDPPVTDLIAYLR
jgi:uncharacterized damage-inducible protein DinB